MKDDLAFFLAVEPGDVVGEHRFQDGIDEGLGIHFCLCRNHVDARFSIPADSHRDEDLLWPVFAWHFSLTFRHHDATPFVVKIRLSLQITATNHRFVHGEQKFQPATS